MSYILDALRRADAERQQGGVPGLHTPASPPPAAPMAPKPWLLWGGAALLLLGLGAVLAWWWARPAPVVVAVVAAPATVVNPAANPTASPSAAPAAAPAAVPAPLPLPIVVSAAPAAPTPTPPPAAVPATVAATVQASSVPAKAIALQQLAPEQRRELPPLVVGGSVWSDNPGSRFVILDGQVVHEGDSVAPGLLLERIQPKAVLLRWRDMRLEIKL